MNILRFTHLSHRYLGWAALLVAPIMLGARGCGVAVVGSECGGLRGAQCGAGQFCDFAPDAACGAADQTGTCRENPNFCTEQFDPVCGCDGQTYGNACAANAAGVSVASEGECAPASGADCGGLLGASCGDGEFCNFAPDAQCGAADQTGTCEPTPEVCTFIFAPVCGCDDQTYDNACAANVAGVSVASEGECAPPTGGGTVCGGLQGGSCAEGEFCNFPLEAICGAADGTGICEAIPTACTREFNPVCGCDDRTYSNACEAHAAGVAIVSEGECAPPTGGTLCGGLQGGSCAEGEFCNFPLEAICGAADGTGICEATPEACLEIFAPVCGCDDTTYGNACEANRAGVSVASEGECAPTGGTVCGGLLGGSCAEGEFCNFPLEAICGAADGTGICEAIPTACTREFNPVCGCDDRTYSNACEAHAAGVAIVSEGECEAAPGGTVCGGLLGAGCAEGEFCSFAPEAQCGAADQTGTCAPIPEACTQQFDPVCGCDGNTYGNACSASNAGVSVASAGECP